MEAKATTRSNRRAVCVLLLVLAVWPAVQFALVTTYDLSPWRFFGWAMYCVPKLPVRLHMYSIRDGAREPLEPSGASIRRAQAKFLRRREIWGTLLPPDALGRLLAESTDTGQTIEIVVEHLVLSPSDARIGARTYRYTYEHDRPERAISPPA